MSLETARLLVRTRSIQNSRCALSIAQRNATFASAVSVPIATAAASREASLPEIVVRHDGASTRSSASSAISVSRLVLPLLAGIAVFSGTW